MVLCFLVVMTSGMSLKCVCMRVHPSLRKLWWKRSRRKWLLFQHFLWLHLFMSQCLTLSSGVLWPKPCEWLAGSWGLSKMLSVLLMIVSMVILPFSELCRAKVELLRSFQVTEYSEELCALGQGQSVSKKSEIYKLSLFLGDDGLLRLQGRLQHSGLPEEEKHPVIIPKCHLSVLLARQAHAMLKHAVSIPCWYLCGTSIDWLVADMCVKGLKSSVCHISVRMFIVVIRLWLLCHVWEWPRHHHLQSQV